MKKQFLLLPIIALLTNSLPVFALEQNEWLSPDQYYYQQLSPEHKGAWENAISNVLSFPSQVKFDKDRRHQALAPMIKSDNPRIFWIDWIDSNGILRYDTGSEPHYGSVTLPEGVPLSDLQTTFSTAVESVVTEIQTILSSDADNQTKVRAVYNWLCENNEYNDAQTSSHKKENDPVAFAYLAAHSAYSGIISDDEYMPVCEGYACAFKVLCDELNVPCICVSGSMTSVSNHMWNYVQLENGLWYQVDVTTGDAYSTDLFCLMNASDAVKYEYTPNPYMGSGVNPDNGFTEGAAFSVPELAQ